ncbi:hypothetical protein, partial [Ralstonia mannitolilytica]
MPNSTDNEAQAMQVYGFYHPLKKQLEDAIGLQRDMERAQSCLQLLIGPPAMLGGASLFVTALYTQALVSYVRCFAKGRRGCLNRDISDGAEGLAELLELVEYVLRHLEGKIERLGNELAEHIVGPGTSWKAANESFA